MLAYAVIAAAVALTTLLITVLTIAFRGGTALARIDGKIDVLGAKQDAQSARLDRVETEMRQMRGRSLRVMRGGDDE